jgi:hypothetical protein
LIAVGHAAARKLTHARILLKADEGDNFRELNEGIEKKHVSDYLGLERFLSRKQNSYGRARRII